MCPMPSLANPALRRKLCSDRPAPAVGQVSPAQALRLSLSRAAQEALRLSVAAIRIEEARLTLAAIDDLIPDMALSVVIRGARGARGLVVLDQTAAAAAVEMQTCGRLSAQPPAPRAPTLTDAVLCSPFFNRMLAGFGAALAGHSAQDCAAGFVAGERLASVRLLPHVLADVVYRAFTMEVEIGGGQRRGSLLLILPWDMPAASAAAAASSGAAPAADAAATAWSDDFTGRIMDSTADFEVVL